MSANSSIEWTDRTWNPVRGCSVISPGCVNCYAMKQAHRFSGPGRAYEDLTKLTKAGPQWTGAIRTIDEALLEPLSWRRPARVFVNSMSDLFHEDVPFDFVCRVFGVMAKASRHTFQILTKRPARMREWFAWVDDLGLGPDGKSRERGMKYFDHDYPWPLPNVWLGVSVEDQQRADERIPLLLQTPAAVRFISAEPLLGPVDLEFIGPTGDTFSALGCRPCAWKQSTATVQSGPHTCMESRPRLDWVIVGGESGPGARRCAARSIRSIVYQCRAYDVPVFVKQMGAFVIDRNDAGFSGCSLSSWPAAIEERGGVEDNIDGYRDDYQGADVRVRLKDRKGGDMDEWPRDLRVREFPKVRA